MGELLFGPGKDLCDAQNIKMMDRPCSASCTVEGCHWRVMMKSSCFKPVPWRYSKSCYLVLSCQKQHPVAIDIATKMIADQVVSEMQCLSRRKFNTSIELRVAYENKSVIMSGPLQRWPTRVHRQPVGPCFTPKTYMAPDAS